MALQGLTAAAFFDRELEGCSATDAMRKTKLSYNTVKAIRRGKVPRAPNAKALEEWSRKEPAAQRAGVYISAAKVLGLEGKSR